MVIVKIILIALFSSTGIALVWTFLEMELFSFIVKMIFLSLFLASGIELVSTLLEYYKKRK